MANTSAIVQVQGAIIWISTLPLSVEETSMLLLERESETLDGWVIFAGLH